MKHSRIGLDQSIDELYILLYSECKSMFLKALKVGSKIDYLVVSPFPRVLTTMTELDMLRCKFTATKTLSMGRMNAKTWKAKDIKALRSSLGLSQAAFADRLGITSNYVYLLEKGVKEPGKTLSLLLNCVEKEKKKGE